jgi:hypothetical protein
MTYSVITSALNDDNFHNHKYLIGKVLKKKNSTNVRRLKKIYIQVFQNCLPKEIRGNVII